MATIPQAMLNDFDPKQRREALEGLLKEHGPLETPGNTFNLHCHSFYSFNGYGMSPSALAWLGREEKLYAMGIVDFDVLDGVDEFLSACALVGVRACAGLETRVFIPEFADREINSPGEPGISYHMGAGFVRSAANATETLENLRQIAETRNRGLVDRVNTFLDPVVLDYDKDVLSLTPSGNATERHVCQAYDMAARVQFPDVAARVAYWADRLSTPAEKIEAILEDGPALQGLIRAKTMKAGGVGYVQPNGPDFPSLETINAFTRANGGLPVMTWLDGLSAGEASIEEMLDIQEKHGAAAVNIIPDRNWNIADAETRARKVAALDRFVAAATARHLPIMVGTEMNAHGQRYVDDFEAGPMRPHYAVFRQGASILSAHTALEASAGLGYLSDWAQAHFPDKAQRNAFYNEVGEKLQPGKALALSAPSPSPDSIIEVLSK